MKINNIFKNVNLVHCVLLMFLLACSFLLIFFKLGTGDLGHYREEQNEIFLPINTEWIIVKNGSFEPIMHYGYNSYHEYMYSTVVEMIIENDNWTRLQIKNFGATLDYYHKGPIYFWLSAVVSKVIGFSIFSVRFWPALLGFLTIVVTYFLARDVFSKMVGLLSVFILATTFQFIHIDGVRAVSIDAAFIFFIVLTIYLLARQEKSAKFFYLAALCVALAVLTRSVLMIIPLFIIFFIIDFILLFKKYDFKYLAKKWLIGLSLILVIVSPWIASQYYHGGDKYIDDVKRFQLKEEFSQKTIVPADLQEKFQFNLFLDERPSDFMFYPMVILKGFFPWSIFVVVAILYALMIGWREKNRKILALVAVVFAILFFVYIKEQKWARYMIDLYPFLAILVAKALYDFYNESKNVFLNIGIAASFLVFYQHVIPYQFNFLLGMIFVMLFLILLFVYFLKNHKIEFKKSIAIFAIIHFGVIAIINVLQPFLL